MRKKKKPIYLTIRNGQTLQNIFLVITESVKIWVVPWNILWKYYFTVHILVWTFNIIWGIWHHDNVSMKSHASYVNFNSLCLVNSACVKWVEKQNYKIFESIKPTYAQLSPKAKWISSFEKLYIFNILKNTYYDNKLTWRLIIPWG